METKVQDVCALMELLAPRELAVPWDNPGLMLGAPEQVVKKIMVSLDLNEEVADQALEQKVDMIITHHPLFMEGKKSLAVVDDKMAFIYRLIQGQVAVFSAHTNLDAACGGVNDVLVQLLELQEAEVFSGGAEDKAGIGRIGMLAKPLTLKGFAKKVKTALGAPQVTYVDAGLPVYKVAVVGGAGADFMQAAVVAGADTLVTGDVKYHGAKDALELGINLIDGTHQFTETPIVGHLAEALTTWATDEGRALTVVTASVAPTLQYI